PRLHFNLAEALWRAGDPTAAETAAEKAAALSDGQLGALRDGLLGNLRYDEARALGDLEGPPAQTQTQPPPRPEAGDPFERLERAIEKVGQARQHFVQGAIALERQGAGDGAALRRNLERALLLERALR